MKQLKEEVNVKLKEVREYLRETELLTNTIGIAEWDFKICMPKNGVESRSQVLSYLIGEQFKRSTSKKVKEFIDYFEPINDELSLVDRAMIRKMKKEYDEVGKIPEDRYRAFNEASVLSQSAWEEAKEKNDFNIFKPHLEKMVSFQREFADYYGYEDNKYDALLNLYEEGITVKKLDKIFKELRDGIIDLLKYIESSKNPVNRDFLQGCFDVEKQKELSEYLLDVIKFDKQCGRLDETEHPFTLDICNKDVRITTHYYEKLLLSNMFSVIHEGGHALYEMHIPDSLKGTGLGTGVSMGIHESQSRFYENIVGRSKPFLNAILPKIKELFPKLKDITLDEFYRAVNYVEPSLIRTEADELTYSLHIIIRYEIEKQLINGEIEVSDLPEVWNEKYKEYLGVEPNTFSEGVLQDMHWSDGSFGYFPSYALGNVYDGHFLNTMLIDNKDAINNLENGDLSFINEWLEDNIHKYGSTYKPEELLKLATGEELNTKYFLDYLRSKYKKIY